MLKIKVIMHREQRGHNTTAAAVVLCPFSMDMERKGQGSLKRGDIWEQRKLLY